MDENKKKTMQWILSAAAAVFFFAFGLTREKTGFCLGDVILNAMGIPAWSAGNQGLHYAATIAIIGAVTSFYIFSRTTKNPNQTLQHLVIGAIAVMMILSGLLNML